MKLFLSPHNDDECLFGAFTLLREKPLLAVVFDSYLQEQRGTGITAWQRRSETEAACGILGVKCSLLSFPDDAPNWEDIEAYLWRLDRDPVRATYQTDIVYAPAIEDGGHEHHNRIGEIADRVFGDRVRHYLTYTKSGKSTNGVPVPYEPEWPLLKLRALACYESQIKLASTAPHFLRGIEEFYQA